MANWIGGSPRQYPVEIFTPNYDLLMEQALERYNVPVFDGFVGVKKPFFDLTAIEEDKIPERWARVWKIHGSINWHQDKVHRTVYRELKTDSEAMLIHPSYLKYDESRKMPFLALFDKLRSFLKDQPSVLIICGYSFSDEHINDVIIQGLRANNSTMAFALLFGKLDQYPKAIPLAEKRSNLSLLAGDEAIISTRRQKWAMRGKDKTEAIKHKHDEGEAESSDKGEIDIFKWVDFEEFGTVLHEYIGADTEPDGVKDEK